MGRPLEFDLTKEYLNKNKCVMKIISYTNRNDVIIEFQDQHKAQVHTALSNIRTGNVKNPYYPSVFGVGIIGNKYPTYISKGNPTKEYVMWKAILNRCFYKQANNIQCYEDCTICDEWLLYENFYEWVHSQENFEQLYNSKIRFDVEKDILIKNNILYSPNTCCIVPHNVNALFVKQQFHRGDYPIGVCYDKEQDKYASYLCIHGRQHRLGRFNSIEEAFINYKMEKEKLIKKIAQEEYDKGNITQKCYKSMINYEVEITD